MTPVVRKLNPNDLEELVDLEKKFNPLRLTDTRAYTNYFLNLDEPDYIFFGVVACRRCTQSARSLWPNQRAAIGGW